MTQNDTPAISRKIDSSSGAGLDLEAIEARAEKAQDLYGTAPGVCDSVDEALLDIPALIAEVRSLRATNRRLNRRAQRAESVMFRERATRLAMFKARTFEQWWRENDEKAVSLSRENTELDARVKELTADRNEALEDAQRQAYRAQCAEEAHAAQGAEMRRLEAEILRMTKGKRLPG